MLDYIRRNEQKKKECWIISDAIDKTMSACDADAKNKEKIWKIKI